MHGCYQNLKKAGGDKVGNVDADAEQGICDAPTPPQSSNPSNSDKGLAASQEHLVRQPAGTWGYIFQIIFQVPLVSNRILLHVDNYLLFDGIVAYSVLWHIRFDNEAETQCVVNALP
ncbi:unnamed protein product [Sphenostylis stenocarpa]|uniref:Uncharacterized protein n=1 Tax=Sphenostylis stenocarpa TaxID=92480 RepID=A0AA86SCW1_9FABA|nr:unnamed protein product [Sphenostylis stenocarpa]